MSGVDNEHGQEVSTVRAEVSAAMAEVLEVSPRCRQRGQRRRCQVLMTSMGEGVLKVAGVRCPQQALAGGVDSEGRGVSSNSGGVGGVTKVWEVSAARAEVSAAMAEEQVSGVNDEGVVKVAGVRCRR